ncbi:MAG: hypothetical protein JO130_08430 [Solirubrobacterales bacterium]|nr:hypothetical protein [Solirubrobacterales bacterium]
MSLARAWRRQLCGASSAALIVPCAMLGALVVLAVGGSFSGVGVLGQIFAGPPTPGVTGGSFGGGHAGGAAPALPVIPAVAVGPVGGPGSPDVGTGGSGTGPRAGAPVPPGAVSRGGGAIVPVASAAPILGGRPVAPVRSAPASPSPASPTPSRSAPPPSPSPKPQPTPVDRIVGAVTPVTAQLPGPVAPATTQVVQSAGSAADGLLAPSSGALGAPSLAGVRVP